MQILTSVIQENGCWLERKPCHPHHHWHSRRCRGNTPALVDLAVPRSSGVQQWHHRVQPEGYLPQGQRWGDQVRPCAQRLQGAAVMTTLERSSYFLPLYIISALSSLSLLHHEKGFRHQVLRNLCGGHHTQILAARNDGGDVDIQQV